MLSKRDVKFFTMGITVGLILIISTTAFAASSVLKQLYVDYTAVKKIVIDGVEKTPPSDMKPFTANGRTYVALKYIADAFGKPVEFNPKNGVITIGGLDNKPTVKTFSDTLTTPPINPKWSILKGSWTIDGLNGLMGESGRETDCGYIALNIDSPKSSQNYTVETEIAYTGFNNEGSTPANYWGGIVINDKNSSGESKPTDDISLGESQIRISGVTSNYPKGFKLEKNQYYKLKVNIKDGMINVYIDGQYITSAKYDATNAFISLACTSNYYKGTLGHYLDHTVYTYFRNFNLTVHD